MPFKSTDGSFSKQEASDPDHIAAFFYSDLIVDAHAHGKSGEW
jgi:hypothetical protein